MKTVRELLRDADPLRHEPHRLAEERDRLRQAVVAATVDVAAPSSTWFRTPLVILTTVTLIILAIAAVGSQMWPHGGATLQAAVRFEMRLAEDHQAAGLQEARVSGSDRVVYLHQEIIVTNSDIAQSSVVPGDGPSRFGIDVQFNAAGAQKMRRATANHVGRLVAILIDGEVVIAPILRAPISTSGLINGDYTKAEAERIVSGIRIR